MSLVYAGGCTRARSSTPEDPIDTPGRFAILTLVVPALALAVSWSVERWRRALTARSEELARRAAELELRLRDAHGELGHWEQRAALAASALTGVSAALPRDIVTAERRLALLADDLREALADNAARQLRMIPAARVPVSRRDRWRPAVVPHERSA